MLSRYWNQIRHVQHTLYIDMMDTTYPTEEKKISISIQRSIETRSFVYFAINEPWMRGENAYRRVYIRPS